ncbi:solute carrier family 2, facilitated glucose transporter member 1-like isoform X1 [Amphibalanus amphitrite]|uniref:solute carrier family 2, facilitated glucose transporter member 1-like isoform X1 n=2 Tax=Amphibalanus amphitrite TaxID=1232801 RepID=UPI001C900F45|nr:solute carrier family 2, facilitated glucose transporter member 1-like isoform X1 [Amphibalanus amphitrite]
MKMQHTCSTAGRDWTPTLVSSVAVALACLVSCGYSIVVLNAPQQVLMKMANASVSEDFGVVLDASSLDLLWGAVVTVVFAGATVGAMAGGSVADRIGRKLSIVVIKIVLATSGILLFIGYEKKHVHWFFLGRIIGGFATGLTSSVCPLYVHEVAPPRLRSVLGIVTNLGFCMGFLLAQVLGLPEVLGRPDTVQYLLVAFLIPTLGAAALLPFCPESPKYLLVNKGSEPDALAALSRLRGLPPQALSSELSDHQAEAKLTAETPRWTLRALLADAVCRRRLLALLVICVGQPSSGITAVFFFSTAIFQRAGLSQSPAALAGVGYGVANVALTLLLGLCVGRVPLKRLLTASCLGCAVCLAAFAGALRLMEWYNWAAVCAVIFLIAFVMSFASGFGTIPWMLGTEMFEQGPRALAVSAGSAAIWVSNCFIGLLFPVVYAQVGVACFIFFLAWCLLSAYVAHFHLPTSPPECSPAKDMKTVPV